MSETPIRVEQAAAGPKRAKTAAGEVEQFRLTDQVAAARYLAGKSVAGNPFSALRIGTFVPPTALGDYERRDHLPPLPTPGG
jgi:hypothetical protein